MFGDSNWERGRRAEVARMSDRALKEAYNESYRIYQQTGDSDEKKDLKILTDELYKRGL